MMSNLVLITSEFPYFSGEPFLLNELPYLSAGFKEIFIFSINGSESDTQTRWIPSNARCFPLGNTTSKSKYAKYMISGLRKPDNDLRITERNLKRIAASLYTRGRASDIANQIHGLIIKYGLNVDNATVYSFWFAYQAVAAWLLAKQLNKRGINTLCVSRAHGYDLYWERALGGYLPFQDASLKNLDWCFPCSEYGRKYLLKKYPWATKKIMTKRLGTKDYGLNPYNGKKTLVTCCNLEPLKRMKLFAETFCIVARTDKQIKWICIGSGEEETIIREIIEATGLSSQFMMMGRVSNEEVIKIYKNEGVKYFCNISTSEGLPVSIMESMSFGIPVIATDVGGTAELVDNSNGYLLPKELTADVLAEYVLDALDEKEDLYLKKRECARLKWESCVSANNNYREFVKIIRCLK